MIIEYHRPDTLEQALALLAREEPLTIPMGGGNSLSRKFEPDFAVVDLQSLGLNKISFEQSTVKVGATVTFQQLLEEPRLSESLMADLRKSIINEVSMNRRNTATIAGGIASCDGRSAFVTALLALEAHLIFAPNAETYLLGDFLRLRNEFSQRKLMIEVRIPSNAILRVELVGRSAQDRPIVCVAVSMWPSGRTRVALGGYGPVPICVLDNPEPGEAIIAAEEAFRSADDQWGSSAYRMDVAGKLVKRILETKDLFLH